MVWADWINLNPQRVGYIASFIDCDGSIHFNVRQRKDRESKRIQIDPRVVFYNGDRGMLEEVQSWFNGKGCLQTVKRRNPQHNIGYQLYFANRQCRDILRTISPCLLRKKRQAEIVEQWYKLRESKSYNSLIGEEEMQLIEKMEQLNRRGVQ